MGRTPFGRTSETKVYICIAYIYISYIHHGNLMVSGGKFEEDVFVDVACL